MVVAGRTAARAIADGNYFQINVYGPTENGYRRCLGSYDPPACESLDEVIACYLDIFGPLAADRTAQGARVAGGSYGARQLDSLIDVTERLRLVVPA
jgi:hypothetical protein